jgi:hypothetical protein
MENNKTEHKTLRLDRDLLEKIEVVLDTENRSFSNLTRELWETYLTYLKTTNRNDLLGV